MIKRISLCALLAFGSLGYLAQDRLSDTPEGFVEAQDVFGSMVRNMSSGNLSSDMRFAAGISLSSDKNVTRERPDVDDSNVFILVKYENGAVATGTGTVILGDDGMGRVLTASHVAETSSPIDRIVSFTADGRAAAILETVHEGNHGADPANLHPRDVQGDTAVMEARLFASEKAKAGWNAMGVRISPIQSDHIMAVTFGQDNTLANSGLSGGSLRLANGDVVGMMNYVFYPEDPRPVPVSEFLERARFLLMAEGDTLGVRDALAVMSVNPPESASYVGGMGIATPIVDKEVLAALHVSGVRVNDALPPFSGTISGYPKNELRSADVIVTPLQGYSLAR